MVCFARSYEGRQKLIDGFVNCVFLYDDRIVFNFNGTREERTLTLEEVKRSGSADKLQPKKGNGQLTVSLFGAFRSACLWSNDMRVDCNARRRKELLVGVGFPTVAFGMSVVFSMTKANIFSGMMR